METSKRTHITPLIARKSFQAGHLKPFSYGLEDIAAAIIDHLKRPNEERTEIQRKGLALFKHGPSRTFTDPEDLDELRKFFDTLNAVFFNSVLTGYCSLDIGIRKLETRCYCMHGEYFADKVECYQDYLLHEMLHAAFDLYACRCANGCGARFSELYSRWNGHDMLWMAAAHAIEQADKFSDDKKNPKTGIMGVQLNVNLNKDRSLAECWNNIPAEAELRRVGLDIRGIRVNLKVRRKEIAEEYGKKQQSRQLLKANRCINEYWLVDERVGCRECNSVLATVSA
ncbi:hypothetical protein L207DRAFT_524780 [Hyaloscypha variabilis F]|uniref:SprT-like domain-containing protein n=1 Tax=Hyaloscypha variabilis (strain UAMH 11265 / GT02V1 / F) TaxID=1149755 RepID=A0A2J6S3R2_HYAVF|nr:hypothetical protein L207DRAFT_524780 [Hyaloscypha variabilis F]